MGAGTSVTVSTGRSVGTEYRGRHGRVVGTTGGWVLVDLGTITVGFRTTELEVTA